MKIENWNPSSSLMRFMALEQQKQKAIDDFNNHAKKEVIQTFEDFLAAFPEIKSVQWSQYTPYFNDGDRCTFNVHDFALEVFEEKRGDLFESDEMWEAAQDDFAVYDGHEQAFDQDSPRAREILASLDSLHKIVDSGLFEAMWGDHSHVTATRESISRQRYEHE
jgi:hypothetical protein